MSDDVPQNRPGIPRECPRCRQPLPERATGRPPEVVLAAMSSRGVRRAPCRRQWSNCVRVRRDRRPSPRARPQRVRARWVSSSSASCRRVVYVLTEIAKAGELRRDPKRQSALATINGLREALVTQRRGGGGHHCAGAAGQAPKHGVGMLGLAGGHRGGHVEGMPRCQARSVRLQSWTGSGNCRGRAFLEISRIRSRDSAAGTDSSRTSRPSSRCLCWVAPVHR
jgi:hypothetical protein